MKVISLPVGHYAAQWPEDVIRTPGELTQLGIDYVDAPEGPEKEARLLEILQCFHNYLLKYVGMILMGHLPMQRNGRAKEINKDTHLLLCCFIPRGQEPNRATLGAACRTLHLAFKGMDAGEVYDQLMMCLVKSIKKYDPYYSNKVKATVGVLEGPLEQQNKFTASEVTKHLGYESATYLRVLVKRGFLTGGLAVAGKESQFARSEMWPVPESLFQNGAVGLSYVASKWYRYYLVDYIHWRMSELEAKDGVMQLNDTGAHRTSKSGDYDWASMDDRGMPHRNGNLTNPRSGRSVAADLTLTDLPVDIGRLSLAWVNEDKGGLFGELSKRDRHLLYCVFCRDMDWESIATTFAVSAREAKRWYTSILEQLQRKVGVIQATDSEDVLAA
jgi:hypothetical protein